MSKVKYNNKKYNNKKNNNKKSHYGRLLVIGMVLLAYNNSHAAVDADPQFSRCIAGLQQRVKSEKIVAPELVDQLLPRLTYVPRVIELDRRQPEFTETFANYLNKRVTDDQVQRGREQLEKNRALLTGLTRTYGIPSQYLVAFWGLETNYGRYLGKMPTLDSLATLACDERRSEFFTRELFAALQLIEREKLVPEAMQGSWAGAVGHTQFMPSAYQRYAIDGDGDGRADLWGSIPDALTSAANFLQGLGWQRELRWGREVYLPDNFPYQEASLGNKRSLQDWSKMGIKRADGLALPDEPIMAALIVPSGYRGPTFLVYDNFEVIMRWNRSQFYGIAVGVLADRINGAGGLRRAPPADAPRLTIAQVEALQQGLQAAGFDIGEVDGMLGPATRNAVRGYQQAKQLIPDGYPDEQVFKSLGINLP